MERNAWWENMAGPTIYLKQIQQRVKSNSSAILRTPDRLPYAEDMRRVMDQRIHEDTPGLILDFADSDDVDGMSPAEFILSRYGKNGIGNLYRGTSGETVQKYIRKNDIMKDRALWLHDLNPGQRSAWEEFIRGYNFRSNRNGVFILETPDEPKRAGADDECHYSDTITSYDYQIYNNYMCAGLRLKQSQKRYLATVATYVYDNRIEVAEVFFQRVATRMTELTDVIREINTENGIDSKNLNDKLLMAQQEALYSMLYAERRDLIRKHYDRIQTGLRYEFITLNGKPSYLFNQQGERITDPYDAEINLLYFMTNAHYYDRPKQCLLVIGNADQKRLRLMHDMRNNLSHNDCCTDEQVQAFLADYPFFDQTV